MEKATKAARKPRTKKTSTPAIAWKKREVRAEYRFRKSDYPGWRVSHAALSSAERAYLRPGTSPRRCAKLLANKAAT